MKKYEILYIIPSPFTETDVPGIQKNVAQIIEENGGKIKGEENLGNKKLAYTIKDIKRGFYILVNFEASPEDVKKIEQKLKLIPEVLRLQITDFVEYKKRSSERRPPRVKVPRKIEPIEASTEGQEETDKGSDHKTINDKIDELLEI